MRRWRWSLALEFSQSVSRVIIEVGKNGPHDKSILFIAAAAIETVVLTQFRLPTWVANLLKYIHRALSRRLSRLDCLAAAHTMAALRCRRIITHARIHTHN